MHAILTTTVGKYTVKSDQYEQARKAVFLLGNDGHFLLTNNIGEYIQSIGNRNVVPTIWTHTPVPMGFDLIALKQQFEERATHVLGDYDSVPNFIKCTPEGNFIFQDNRYYCDGINGAWMMYVDQAIEHFNSKAGVTL